MATDLREANLTRGRDALNRGAWEAAREAFEAALEKAETPDALEGLGWALFYQLVNLGAFIGPPLAGFLRLMSWKWVFVCCAGIVALNYLLLPTIKEPEKSEEAQSSEGFMTTLIKSAEGILEPRLLAFLAIFSGFWAMFYQLFDMLPNFIEDWVDSSDVYDVMAAPLFGLFGSSPPAEWAGMVPQEHMINLNAGLIMLFAFLVGYLTGFLRSMQAMIAGILVAAIGIYSLGLRTTAQGPGP